MAQVMSNDEFCGLCRRDGLTGLYLIERKTACVGRRLTDSGLFDQRETQGYLEISEYCFVITEVSSEGGCGCGCCVVQLTESV